MWFLETPLYTYRLTMMFKKLCAVALLVLVASPFTAPFQTYDLAVTSDVGLAAFLVVVSEPAADAAYDSRWIRPSDIQGAGESHSRRLRIRNWPGWALRRSARFFRQRPATPTVPFATRFFDCNPAARRKFSVLIGLPGATVDRMSIIRQEHHHAKPRRDRTPRLRTL